MATVNEAQQDYLLTYMECHSGFAAHKFMGLDGKRQLQDQWNRLMIALNTLGPEKTVESWSRYWRDMKKAAREYNAQTEKKIRKTGNKADQIIDFNELHERVLNIVGRYHGNGLAFIPEIGISSRAWDNKITARELPSVSASAIVPIKKEKDENSVQLENLTSASFKESDESIVPIVNNDSSNQNYFVLSPRKKKPKLQSDAVSSGAAEVDIDFENIQAAHLNCISQDNIFISDLNDSISVLAANINTANLQSAELQEEVRIQLHTILSITELLTDKKLARDSRT